MKVKFMNAEWDFGVFWDMFWFLSGGNVMLGFMVPFLIWTDHPVLAIVDTIWMIWWMATAEYYSSLPLDKS